MKTLLIAVAFALLAVVYASITQGKIQKQRAEIERLTQNVHSLNNDKRYFRFRDSLRAAEMSALVLKYKELKDLRAEDERTIRELRLKPKDVVTISKLETVIRDSVVYIFRDSCINFSNKWITFEACLNDTVLHYSVRDSIASYLFVEYQRKFLWWRWKPRYKVVSTSLSPHSSVVNGETILLR